MLFLLRICKFMYEPISSANDILCNENNFELEYNYHTLVVVVFFVLYNCLVFLFFSIHSTSLNKWNVCMYTCNLSHLKYIFRREHSVYKMKDRFFFVQSLSCFQCQDTGFMERRKVYRICERPLIFIHCFFHFLLWYKIMKTMNSECIGASVVSQAKKTKKAKVKGYTQWLCLCNTAVYIPNLVLNKLLTTSAHSLTKVEQDVPEVP